MEVKDLIRGMMDKDPNDVVAIRVKAKLYTNDQKCITIERQVELDDIQDGGWPVVVTADVAIEARTTIEMF